MFNQLQQQLQNLREEANSISQLAIQLQQSEQANSTQLQQLQQKEVTASQNLQRIQYLANHLNQGLAQAGSLAQQMTGTYFPQTQGTFQYNTPASQFTQAQAGWAIPYTMGQTVAGAQYAPSMGWGASYSTPQTGWSSQISTSPTAFGSQYGFGTERAEFGAQYNAPQSYQTSPMFQYTPGQTNLNPATQYSTNQAAWGGQF